MTPRTSLKKFHYTRGCWARINAKRLQHNPHTDLYENGFEPEFVPRLLKDHKKLKPGQIVAVGLMGDITFISFEQRIRVINELIKEHPRVTFFLESKNPGIFQDLVQHLPENVILSTTIETDNFKLYERKNYSKAPNILKRYLDFQQLNWPWKHVSVEPMVKPTSCKGLIAMVERIAMSCEKCWISVGTDNYNTPYFDDPSNHQYNRVIKAWKNSKYLDRVENKDEGNSLMFTNEEGERYPTINPYHGCKYDCYRLRKEGKL